MKFDSKETDELRLNNLSQQYALPFNRVRSTYIFEDFTAHGLRQALGFVEGFDLVMASNSSEELDEYGLETAYEVLAACDINDCKQAHDAARKTSR